MINKRFVKIAIAGTLAAVAYINRNKIKDFMSNVLEYDDDGKFQGFDVHAAVEIIRERLRYLLQKSKEFSSIFDRTDAFTGEEKTNPTEEEMKKMGLGTYGFIMGVLMLLVAVGNKAKKAMEELKREHKLA